MTVSGECWREFFKQVAHNTHVYLSRNVGEVLWIQPVSVFLWRIFCGLAVTFLIDNSLFALDNIVGAKSIIYQEKLKPESFSNGLKSYHSELRTYSSRIFKFYFIERFDRSSKLPSADDVYVMLEGNGGLFQLRHYVSGSLLHEGCVFSKADNRMFFISNRLGQTCPISIQHRIKRKQLTNCLSSVDLYNKAENYLYDPASATSVCLYEQVDARGNQSIIGGAEAKYRLQLSLVIPDQGSLTCSPFAVPLKS